MTGEGVEADTVQAALWCQRAAKAGNEEAIELLPIILKCDFCGSTPARQLCNRCLMARYCGAGCQAGHWNTATEPHKGPCKDHRRPAAEASEQQ
jgi:TPR repeat protein